MITMSKSKVGTSELSMDTLHFQKFREVFIHIVEMSIVVSFIQSLKEIALHETFKSVLLEWLTDWSDFTVRQADVTTHHHHVR